MGIPVAHFTVDGGIDLYEHIFWSSGHWFYTEFLIDVVHCNNAQAWDVKLKESSDFDSLSMLDIFGKLSRELLTN